MDKLQNQLTQKKWTVVARYCSGNAWLLPRIVYASNAEEARKKAEIRFPNLWCGYQLTQILVMPYIQKYNGIVVKDLLENYLPIFRKYRNHPADSMTKIQRGHRVRHYTGKENK